MNNGRLDRRFYQQVRQQVGVRAPDLLMVLLAVAESGRVFRFQVQRSA